MWLEQVTLTPSNLSFLICNWDFKCLVYGGGEEVRIADHLDSGLSYFLATMSLPLQLFAPVSHAALLTRDYLRSQLARRTDPEQVLSKDGLKGIQSPFRLTSTKGSRDHHLAALTLIPDGQSCERSTFQITGLVVGKQLIKVQGSVLCSSFTDNTRHWYLNSTP